MRELKQTIPKQEKKTSAKPLISVGHYVLTELAKKSHLETTEQHCMLQQSVNVEE